MKVNIFLDFSHSVVEDLALIFIYWINACNSNFDNQTEIGHVKFSDLIRAPLNSALTLDISFCGSYREKLIQSFVSFTSPHQFVVMRTLSGRHMVFT